ncbi:MULTISPECIES: hypothetical protein [unclassified Microcoleus]|uniref:hypothetical protein n=1 Tax=unclassified Microcoleus TaxID=2642155 RepID=UPI002FCF1E1E
MQLTLNSDFSDEWCELPEAEFQPLLDFESEVLNEAPHNDIASITQSIRQSFLDYVRQGIMLGTVKRYRLYKRQYSDFAEYCKSALGRSHFYCKKIIQAAQVTLELIKTGFKILPTSVAQALPLLKFAKIDEYGGNQLADKWQTVLDGFPPQAITAAKISETLDENPEDKAKQVRIGGKAYQILQEKATAAGLSVSKYLELLISGEEVPDGEPPEEEPPENEGVPLTAEKERICDRAEAYAKLQSQARANRSDKVSDSS